MKAKLAVLTALISGPAFADPGHFAESHGHSHWFALGTLALAAVIGAIALRRGHARRSEKQA